jgi:3-hydroxyisobutyrate dehydrogenase-like beta-hydroxyacid dehydrogenase
MATMSEPRVGVVGLGAMGGRMARRLLAAGYQVYGYNRSPGRLRPLAQAGLLPCATPRELAGQVDVILGMVWDSDALRAVTGGPDGLLAGLRPGQVFVDLSTVEPEVSAEVAGEVEARGAAMLDCPVSGSLDAAESGRLVLLVGGPRAALDQVRPVLDQLGNSLVHLGATHGLGLSLKLAINLQVALQELAFGEGLIVAERAGISRDKAIEAMLASVIASPMLRYRVPFVLREPDEVWASAAQLRKDVAYAVDQAGGALRAGDLALRVLDAICAAGEGEQEAAALIRTVADRRHEFDGQGVQA